MARVKSSRKPSAKGFRNCLQYIAQFFKAHFLKELSVRTRAGLSNIERRMRRIARLPVSGKAGCIVRPTCRQEIDMEHVRCHFRHACML